MNDPKNQRLRAGRKVLKEPHQFAILHADLFYGRVDRFQYNSFHFRRRTYVNVR